MWEVNKEGHINDLALLLCSWESEKELFGKLKMITFVCGCIK